MLTYLVNLPKLTLGLYCYENEQNICTQCNNQCSKLIISYFLYSVCIMKITIFVNKNINK